MTKIISGKAFAKLNLYLGVRGLRPDGYHELETVFQSIDLCDLVAMRQDLGGLKFYPIYVLDLSTVYFTQH